MHDLNRVRRAGARRGARPAERPSRQLEHRYDRLDQRRSAVPEAIRACGARARPTGKVTSMAPVSLVVVGAGERGTGYARWARRHPDRASVVAVAEPSEVRRARFAAEHGIPAQHAAADWRELAGRGRLA